MAPSMLQLFVILLHSVVKSVVNKSNKWTFNSEIIAINFIIIFKCQHNNNYTIDYFV